MSTFIDGNGENEMDKVLIQLDTRFLIFDAHGNFIDQPKFSIFAESTEKK